MVATASATEGYVPFRGYHTWYRIVGEGEDPGKMPLLCLHGGPGAPHSYLQPLEGAATGRRIIFYDQLGCGNSDQPSDPSMWTMELFLDELQTVRDALGLDHVHLLGQSWGGFLAQEYALTQPTGLESLILASTAASAPHFASEALRLKRELPEEIQAILEKHEEAGTFDDPEYTEAGMVFYGRHVCRMEEWPEYVVGALENMRHEIYNTMWGPSEFTMTGTLSEWDVTDRLGEITVPTLITCGRYDEATPALAEELHAGIHGSELRIIEEGSHLAHVEHPEEYLRILTTFLERVEGGATT